MTKEKVKKRNHFLPETYLDKFFNESDILYLYKKGKQFFEKRISLEDRLVSIEGRKNLDNIAVKNNLYIPEGDFPDKNLFENFFDKEIESKYNLFIDDIQNLSYSEVIDKHQEYILGLTASMMSRTLHSKEEIEEMYKTNFQIHNRFKSRDREHKESLKKELFEKQPGLSEQEAVNIVESYFQEVKEGKFAIKIPRNLFIKEMFSRMEMMLDIISSMNIHILKNKTTFLFITSDNPVVYFVPPDKTSFYFGPKSLGGPYTELYFPLSKEICVLMTRRKEKDLDYIEITQGNLARTINYNIAHNSKNFIFSPDKNEFLNDFIRTYIPYPFKMKIT